MSQPDRARLRELAYTYAHAPAGDTKDVAGNRFYAALDTLLDRLDELEAENKGLRDELQEALYAYDMACHQLNK